MRTPAIMIQGTGSHVGKSVMVAGLARALVRRGLRVAPFKPQNMSNNAAVAADGGEIGRAQALQARAARVPASVHMNPVLLKPESETGAQVIVQGQRFGTMRAVEYGRQKAALLPKVLESFALVARDADIVLVEGAGSPAEINLRAGDIANMGFAEAADVPVVLVGDIDRGGVIASLVGTHAVLAPGDRARVAGFIVNKFRGDVGLFAEGVREIEARTGWRGLGVVPWFADAARLPAEDVLGLVSGVADGATSTDEVADPGSPSPQRPLAASAGDDTRRGGLARDDWQRRASAGDATRRSGLAGDDRPIAIAVPQVPRIANFDDLDPLRAEPGVRVIVVKPGEAIPVADLVLLPGSKSTIADLAFLKAQGWDIDIRAHVRRGGRVLGLCGGYQMLGRTIADPDGVEGKAGTVEGLGLLDVATILGGDKTTTAVNGHHVGTGQPVSGYEIHLGRTQGPDGARPMLEIGERMDGAQSADGLVAGTYVHGLFAADGFRRAYLAGLGAPASDMRYEATVEATLDALAEHLERYVDIDRLLAIAGYDVTTASATTATKSARLAPR